MRRMLLAGLLVTGLLLLTMGLCQAQAENQTPAAAAAPAPPAVAKDAGHGKGRAWMAQLTDEQRQQVQAKIKEMKAANAKPEEIKAAVAEMLKGFGITPDPGKNKQAGKGAGKGEARGFMAQLTADQRAQVLAKIKEMKAAGKTPEEIKAAVAEMLKGWGIDTTPGAGGGQGREWMAKLTPEQRDQVQAKIKELRAAGKTPEEIKAAIAAMLKEWGIEGGPGQGAGQAGQLKGILDKLTPEQRTQVLAKIKELKAAGKTREEIKAAVAEMLKGWGVEVGAGPGQGQGGPLKALMEKLTPDQRQQVQAKVKELRDAGKTRPEIKAAVLEMLKGWGVEAPQ